MKTQCNRLHRQGAAGRADAQHLQPKRHRGFPGGKTYELIIVFLNMLNSVNTKTYIYNKLINFLGLVIRVIPDIFHFKIKLTSHLFAVTC